MKNRFFRNGFTMTELLVIMAIMVILVTIAIPSYQTYVLKANRGEAQQLLMHWANLQEIWRSNNATFADDVASPNGIPLPTHEDFTFSLGTPNPPTATAYILVATGIDDQADDHQYGTSCTTMTLDQIGAKTPTDCWK